MIGLYVGHESKCAVTVATLLILSDKWLNGMKRDPTSPVTWLICSAFVDVAAIEKIEIAACSSFAVDLSRLQRSCVRNGAIQSKGHDTDHAEASCD